MLGWGGFYLPHLERKTSLLLHLSKQEVVISKLGKWESGQGEEC